MASRSSLELFPSKSCCFWQLARVGRPMHVLWRMRHVCMQVLHMVEPLAEKQEMKHCKKGLKRGAGTTAVEKFLRAKTGLHSMCAAQRLGWPVMFCTSLILVGCMSSDASGETCSTGLSAVGAIQMGAKVLSACPQVQLVPGSRENSAQQASHPRLQGFVYALNPASGRGSIRCDVFPLPQGVAHQISLLLGIEPLVVDA